MSTQDRGPRRKTDQVNLKLSELGMTLLETLCTHWGSNKTTVVEQLLREEARRQGLIVPLRVIADMATGKVMGTTTYDPQGRPVESSGVPKARPGVPSAKPSRESGGG